MKKLTNVAASVRQRLLNLSKERAEDFLTMLIQFAGERLLYRLSKSPHAKDFVLKGATLFSIWTGAPHRATRDVDLLGFGSPTPERLARVFAQMCEATVEPDGLEFLRETVETEGIREGQVYVGVRVKLSAKLAAAVIPVQIDVGFGDSVVPAPSEAELPGLLELPRAILRIYPRETVVAEKLHAIAVLGLTNSRLKDYFDLWFLGRRFDFEGETLVSALRATFRRRETPIPSTLMGLSPAFWDDPGKRSQWAGFIKRTRPPQTPPPLPEVGAFLHPFLLPVVLSAHDDAPAPRTWRSGGPWCA